MTEESERKTKGKMVKIGLISMDRQTEDIKRWANERIKIGIGKELKTIPRVIPQK